ncbi:MAG: alpha-amylase family glycosyl hydrolase, partial [Lutibacter sp.]
MRTILIIAMVLSTISCVNTQQKKQNEKSDTKQKLTSISDKNLENAVIYEANIRQYSKEGTFKAFTKDIPQLKELGVKIIWVMPIYP